MTLLSKIPLRFSVPLIMVTPVLLVAVVLAAVAYVQGRANARDLTRQSFEHVNRQIDSHLDQLLSAPGRINAVNKSLVRQGRLPADDLPAWRETVIAQLHANSFLTSVVFGSADGRAVWITRYLGDDEFTYFAVNPPGDSSKIAEFRVDASGSMSDEPVSTFDYDPRVRPWFEAAITAGHAAWCEPFVFVGGSDADTVTLGISYAEPMFDAGGGLIGVIDTDLSLNDISQFLERIEIGKTGGVYIVDPTGLIIGSSLDAALASAEGNRFNAADSVHPWIRQPAAHVQAVFGSFAGISEAYMKTVSIDGQRMMLMASPYKHETGISWVTLTLIPEADFLAGVHAASRRSLYIAAGASLLTMLLGLVAAMFMVRPMARLTAHVRQIGEGELDQKIHLTESPELVRLSGEINEMTAGLRDRMRMRHSLAVAMDVQQALLPDGSPKVEGLDVSGHSTYCDETGGDYYDFLDVTGLSDKSVCVALGDVMGHGVAAAMLMATARGILRSHSQEPHTLADLLDHMNQLLVPDTGGKRFMTMLLMTLDVNDHILRWASAGHEPPFYYDPNTNEYQELDGSGLPLGVIAEEDYEEYSFTDVQRGQVFFMATDGVWEMQNSQNEQFGKHRIRELIQRHHAESAEVIGEQIREALREFRGDGSQDDDVTFVIVRVE